VLVNESAGSAGPAAPAALDAAFRRHGATATVRSVPGGALARAARRAVEEGADVVVAAGGDGTVSAVASQVAGSPAALGIVPIGTLNHFARDLRLPLDLDEAIEAVVSGLETRCDVGRLGRRVFVNNATLGLYADLVLLRERWRPRIGKWPAGALAAAAVLRRFPTSRLSVTADGRTATVRTPLLVVSNNPFGLGPGRPHGRPRLDGGTLGLYVAGTGRRALLSAVLRGVSTSLDGDPAFEASTARRVVVESPRPHVRLALDGEAVRVRPPLRFESAAGALRVAGTDGASEAASAA
jgi:diacylglycerol kinase family enzyme